MTTVNCPDGYTDATALTFSPCIAFSLSDLEPSLCFYFARVDEYIFWHCRLFYLRSTVSFENTKW